MNKIHKSQYNESLGTWVAVPEIAKGGGKPTTVAKDIPTISSLPKFAVSALTLALLQVVSVSAYAGDSVSVSGSSSIAVTACNSGDNYFSCGQGLNLTYSGDTAGTAVGNLVYANMSTAVGNNIGIGNQTAITNYETAYKTAVEKYNNNKNIYNDVDAALKSVLVDLKKKDKNALVSGEQGKNSVAYGSNIRIYAENAITVGNNITVDSSNAVAIGNDIKKTKENSVFLGNNSGYVANDGSKSLGSDVGTTEQLKLSDDVVYAGASNVGGVVSIASGGQTRRIQGVAPGLVSKNSADAINGAQLSAAYDVIDDNTKKIADNTKNIAGNTKNIAGNTKNIAGNTKNIAGNTTKIEDNTTKIEKGWDIAKVDKGTVTNEFKETKNANIKLGDTVNFADSDTVSVALKKDSNDKVAVQFDINQDKVSNDTLTQLPVVYTDNAGNIVQRGKDGKWYKSSEIVKAKKGDYTGLTGIGDNDIIAAIHNPVDKNGHGNPFKLTNLAEGAVNADSKDAVNGSQLFATNNNVNENTKKINQGWNIGKIADVSALKNLDDINTDQKIALGDSVKFAAADGVSVALKKVNDKAVAVQIGLDKDKVHADTLAQLPVVYTDEAGNIVQRVGDKWYKTSEIEKAKGDYTKLSGGIGDNDIIAAIHNPADKNSKHGNPFKLTNLADGLISDNSHDAVNGSQLFAERKRLATYLGGGAEALPTDKGFKAPEFKVKKANGDVYQIGTGSNAKDVVADNVGDALDNLNDYVNKGITVVDNKGGSGSLTPTETLKFADGSNTTAKVSKNETTGTVTVKIDVKPDTIASITSDVLTQGPVIYTVKNGSENAPVVKIKDKWYLAKDVTNNKPVVGAQEQAADKIKASLRNPKDATEETAGSVYVLNNVADGVADFDAINKRQFDYAVVYGDSANPNYAKTADHSVVKFKGKTVNVLKDGIKAGTTEIGTGTQLQNVASAGDIYDEKHAGYAVNAGDLKYHVDKLTKKGLDFAGDTGSVHKDLGETLKVTGDDNIKVAASNGGLQISIKPDPTFAGKVTAEGGVVAGKKNAIEINTDGKGKIDGLTNVSIDKLDDGSKGTSIAATEAQLDKVIAKINSNDKNIKDRIDEGRVFTDDMGDEVKVGLGEPLAVKGGIDDKSKLSDDNIGVVTKDKGLEIKLGKELKGINSIALIAPNLNPGNGGTVTPSPTTSLDNNGIKIKPSAVNGANVALTDTGLDNGGNKIVNVGAGDIKPDGTDAVNAGQLYAQGEAIKKIIGGPVTYDENKNNYVVKKTDRDGNPTGIGGTGEVTIDAAIKAIKNRQETPYAEGKNIVITSDPQKPGTKVISTADDVEFNSIAIAGANPNKSVKINGTGIDAGDMKVRHVAAGEISPLSKDAVNGSQLYQVKQDINEMDKRARSGIASAMASAGLPQAYLPGKSMIGAAASNYRGETAIAIGVSTISDNGKWLVKADANANRKDFGVSLGVGYQW